MQQFYLHLRLDNLGLLNKSPDCLERSLVPLESGVKNGYSDLTFARDSCKEVKDSWLNWREVRQWTQMAPQKHKGFMCRAGYSAHAWHRSNGIHWLVAYHITEIFSFQRTCVFFCVHMDVYVCGGQRATLCGIPQEGDPNLKTVSVTSLKLR